MEGITVICLSFQRPDFFLRMVESLPKHEAIVQKILIQNGTDQETEDIAIGDGWEVYKPGKNLSFSEGNNLGAKGAIGSHLLLVNNDVEFDPGCIEALWKKRDLPLLGCLIETFDGRLIHAGCGFRARDMMPLHLNMGIDPKTITVDRYVPWATGACWLARKDIWNALGGLDEKYWYGWEDVDYCVRLLEKYGQQALVVHDAVVKHDFQGTRNSGEVDPANAEYFHKKMIRTKRLQDALGVIYDQA